MGMVVYRHNGPKKKLMHRNRHTIYLYPIEHIETLVNIHKQNITIVSIYIPPKINKEQLEQKFNNLFNTYTNHNNIIFGGDFNAYNNIWNNNKMTDYKGRIIGNIINNSNFTIINNGDNTREDCQGRQNYTKKYTHNKTSIHLESKTLT